VHRTDVPSSVQAMQQQLYAEEKEEVSEMVVGQEAKGYREEPLGNNKLYMLPAIIALFTFLHRQFISPSVFIKCM